MRAHGRHHPRSPLNTTNPTAATTRLGSVLSWLDENSGWLFPLLAAGLLRLIVLGDLARLFVSDQDTAALAGHLRTFAVAFSYVAGALSVLRAYRTDTLSARIYLGVVCAVWVAILVVFLLQLLGLA